MMPEKQRLGETLWERARGYRYRLLKKADNKAAGSAATENAVSRLFQQPARR
jgi:hypothetical protein